MILTAVAFAVQGQSSKPITKRGLVEALRLKGLTEQELMHHVEQRGVDFQLTAQDQTDLKEAGAGQQLLQVVRANYRPNSEAPIPKSAANPTSVAANPNSPPPTITPTKPAPTVRPLSNAEIVTLLETGVPSDRVEKLVEVRGVSFSPSAENSAEITAAGGSRSLLGAIAQTASAGYAPAPSVPATSAPNTVAVRSAEAAPAGAPTVAATKPRSGSRVFIAPMDGNLNGFLATEIVKKKIPVVLVTDEKDAEFILTGASLAGDNKWYNTVFGGRDKHEGNVQMVSVAGKQVVWAGEAGDRSLWWGNLRRGGQRKVADRIAKAMKKELF
jgi:hypothetical protein